MHCQLVLYVVVFFTYKKREVFLKLYGDDKYLTAVFIFFNKVYFLYIGLLFYMHRPSKHGVLRFHCVKEFKKKKSGGFSLLCMFVVYLCSVCQNKNALCWFKKVSFCLKQKKCFVCLFQCFPQLCAGLFLFVFSLCFKQYFFVKKVFFVLARVGFCVELL